MESFGGGSGFTAMSSVMKKRRSTTSRKPRPDSQFVVEARDGSSHSSTPSSDNIEGMGSSRIASVNNMEGTGTSRKVRKEERKYGDLSELYGNDGLRGIATDLKRCSEGALAPANWKSSSKVIGSSEKLEGIQAGGGNGSAENKLKKVRLKVGGVTHTFHAKSNLETGNSGFNVKSQSSDAPRHRQKLILQDNSDDDPTPTEKVEGSQGVPSRDFSGGSVHRALKEDSRGRQTEDSSSGKQVAFPEPVRKSKRVPKRRVLDGALEEGDEDDEIRYLEKLKSAKVTTVYNSDLDDDGEENSKQKSISKVSKSKRSGYFVDESYSSRSAKENRKKPRIETEFDDTDYVEEEELGSDDGVDPKRKKQKKESLDTLPDARGEPLTTRQRALQSGKGASVGGSLIEFPDGLPPAPPRKQKQKLSEVEQQAKKAEAAQRRRMQVEKQAKESEAEAIRKILGQDSNRKKKEEKLKKERDELAQRKAAEYLVLAPNCIRMVMGPSGTTLVFGEDVGLPSMFEPKTSSYPPPREKCAAPSCTNTYKYRDSKLNLPLCSLQCYRAVRESSHTVSTC